MVSAARSTQRMAAKTTRTLVTVCTVNSCDQIRRATGQGARAAVGDDGRRGDRSAPPMGAGGGPSTTPTDRPRPAGGGVIPDSPRECQPPDPAAGQLYAGRTWFDPVGGVQSIGGRVPSSG